MNIFRKQRRAPSALVNRMYTSNIESSAVLERWLKGWTATPPAMPMFDGADPPTGPFLFKLNFTIRKVSLCLAAVEEYFGNEDTIRDILIIINTFFQKF